MIFGLAVTNLVIIVLGMILFFFGSFFFKNESAMVLIFLVPAFGLASMATSLILSSLIFWEHWK